MSVSDDVYFSFQDEALSKTIGQLLEETKVFLNPDYDLKKTVENDTDFLLGATFSEIIDHMNWLIYGSKTPKPKQEQLQKLNRRLFSMAPEFKNTIIKTVGM
ncbi:MAG: hypothetical protein M3146_05150 [Thermoproteota archaeon]|nr:hypothetical protein [Thermoproteota archaeon]